MRKIFEDNNITIYFCFKCRLLLRIVAKQQHDCGAQCSKREFCEASARFYRGWKKKQNPVRKTREFSDDKKIIGNRSDDIHLFRMTSFSS